MTERTFTCGACRAKILESRLDTHQCMPPQSIKEKTDDLLKNEFAKAALTGILSNSTVRINGMDEIAIVKTAWMLANEMIKNKE